MSFTDKSVLVTGSTTGIGEASYATGTTLVVDGGNDATAGAYGPWERAGTSGLELVWATPMLSTGLPLERLASAALAPGASG